MLPVKACVGIAASAVSPSMEITNFNPPASELLLLRDPAVSFQRTIFIVLSPMFSRGSRSAFAIALPIVGIVLLAAPGGLHAQRGGGGGGAGMGGAPRNATPIICVHDCPELRDGLSPTDDLKNFRRALAVQATAEQRAAFAKVAQYTQSASDDVQTFRKALPPVLASTASPSALPDRAATLDQAVAQARAGNQNFLTSLSSEQKSGLQDLTKRLAKADFDLDKQIKTFDQIVHAPKPETGPIAASAAALDQALASFQSEQLALGREMSALFDPAGQNTFSLPPVTDSITIDGQPISIPMSGALVSRGISPTSAENGHNLFGLKLVDDLSDLQQNITGILRSRITRDPRCGERIEIQQATLTPLAPASLVVANLHFEHWVCPPGQSSNPIEVADGNATLEVKLTASVGQNGGIDIDKDKDKIGLVLASEITRVEADGFLRDSLRSGDLGVTLREQIAASLLSALQKIADLKAALPVVAQPSATIQKAAFQNDGADQMSLVLDGQLQFSDEQIQQFAAQLKQRLAAQGTTRP
jgi:hypothetical protein